LFGFSTLVLTNDLAVSFAGQAGVFILSRMTSVSDAGLFSLATYMTDTVRKTLMSILNRVTFVHYSSIQNDKEQLKKSYLSTLTWNCRMIFPVMTTFMLFGPEILIDFLGANWRGMEGVVIWLSIAVMVHAAGGTTSTLYKGVGRPGLDLSIFLGTTVFLLFPGIVLGVYQGGLLGAAVATAVTRLISIMIRQVFLDNLLGKTASKVIKIVAHMLLLQLPIVAAWSIYRHFFSENHYVGILLALVGLAAFGLMELPRSFPKIGKRLGITRMPWSKETVQ
jgi:teichuronic acid exporter